MKKRERIVKNTIKVQRALRDMSQKELAESIGVSRQTIVQLEKNKYNPSLILAHDIAELFNTDIESLFTFDTSE